VCGDSSNALLGGRPRLGTQLDCLMNLSLGEKAASMIAVSLSVEPSFAKPVYLPRLAQQTAGASVLGPPTFVMRHTFLATCRRRFEGSGTLLRTLAQISGRSCGAVLTIHSGRTNVEAGGDPRVHVPGLELSPGASGQILRNQNPGFRSANSN
jgi:hypothetical protein